MSDTLHILPSTNDFEALAQIRILARRSLTKHTCVCLHDPTANHVQLQQWMGANVILHTPTSRSFWMQASQLYRIGKTLRISPPQNLCWNPGRFSISALPLLTQLESWGSIITTPSKRELTFPCFAGNYALKKSKHLYVSSEYLKSEHFPNSEVLPPLVEDVFLGQPHLDLKKEYGLPESATLVVGAGRFDSFSRFKEAIWIMGILEHLHPDIHLVLLGTGEQAKILKNYRDQMVLRPRIHFLDPWCEPTSLIHQADCLLVTADHSGQDWGCQQAVHLNIPVVASRSDGNLECITHNENGFIGGPAAGGLAKYIHQLITETNLFPVRNSGVSHTNKQNWDAWNRLLTSSI
ncbi:MAG: glycosyltransferase [Pirellulales bacterium]|nr:glycosyltransferase [Pirellulales bacterium]|tara:strand:- start:716 stop:1765 length:1050 start_codon:yes stop_codon:yes gene_type:complete